MNIFIVMLSYIFFKKCIELISVVLIFEFEDHNSLEKSQFFKFTKILYNI